jgi:hypothetical protein
VGVGYKESHPGEHYRQIFQEVMHKQGFGQIRRWEDNDENKDDNDWVESTDNDSVKSDDGKYEE